MNGSTSNKRKDIKQKEKKTEPQSKLFKVYLGKDEMKFNFEAAEKSP